MKDPKFPRGDGSSGRYERAIRNSSTAEFSSATIYHSKAMVILFDFLKKVTLTLYSFLPRSGMVFGTDIEQPGYLQKLKIWKDVAEGI